MTAMALLNDHGLRQVISRKFPAAKQRKMDRLLDEKQAGRLKEDGIKELNALVAEAEHFILLRAHAAALLSQRGYKLDPAHSLPSAG